MKHEKGVKVDERLRLKVQVYIKIQINPFICLNNYKTYSTCCHQGQVNYPTPKVTAKIISVFQTGFLKHSHLPLVK